MATVAARQSLELLACLLLEVVLEAPLQQQPVPRRLAVHSTEEQYPQAVAALETVAILHCLQARVQFLLVAKLAANQAPYSVIHHLAHQPVAQQTDQHSVAHQYLVAGLP
jgi:hypothetical protein